jgi:hypothetical protein
VRKWRQGLRRIKKDPTATIFLHSDAHITAISPFATSIMPGRSSVSTVEERRQCITIVFDYLLRNALMAVSASKHYDHVHTSHRSTCSIGLVGAAGAFPVTRGATEFMHDYLSSAFRLVSGAYALGFLVACLCIRSICNQSLYPNTEQNAPDADHAAAAGKRKAATPLTKARKKRNGARVTPALWLFPCLSSS